MTTSNGGNKPVRESARAEGLAANQEEWAQTRAVAREDGDEWQPTRVLARPIVPGDEWQPTRAVPADANGARPLGTPPAEPPSRRGTGESPDAWAQTRAQTALATQLLADENDYLAEEKHAIGRQIGGNEHELFVSCGPAEAMQQQFEHLQPEFIAVHDIATASSRKLLAGIAAASGRSLQKLVIRRQGYGTALATLEFVELPTSDRQSLRLYTTEADADTAARHALARVLLGYSRLGVVMVGELPGHAIGAALKPLHDDIVAGPWPNRNLLLLPLASASTLVTHGLDLGRGTGVAVRTTPQVARPADAWSFITGTWSRLREQHPEDGRVVPELGAFRPPAYQPGRAPLATGIPSGDTLPMEDGLPPPVEKLALKPMPAIINPGIEIGQPPTLMGRYVKQVSELNGVISVCAFDTQTGQALAHAGASPRATELALNGSALVAAMLAASRNLGLGHALPEAAITLGSHHLLVRGVPRHPTMAIHVVLDKTSANLTLARLQILRLDAVFDEPPAIV